MLYLSEENKDNNAARRNCRRSDPVDTWHANIPSNDL